MSEGMYYLMAEDAYEDYLRREERTVYIKINIITEEAEGAE